MTYRESRRVESLSHHFHRLTNTPNILLEQAKLELESAQPSLAVLEKIEEKLIQANASSHQLKEIKQIKGDFLIAHFADKLNNSVLEYLNSHPARNLADIIEEKSAALDDLLHTIQTFGAQDLLDLRIKQLKILFDCYFESHPDGCVAFALSLFFKDFFFDKNIKRYFVNVPTLHVNYQKLFTGIAPHLFWESHTNFQFALRQLQLRLKPANDDTKEAQGGINQIILEKAKARCPSPDLSESDYYKNTTTSFMTLINLYQNYFGATPPLFPLKDYKCELSKVVPSEAMNELLDRAEQPQSPNRENRLNRPNL